MARKYNQRVFLRSVSLLLLFSVCLLRVEQPTLCGTFTNTRPITGVAGGVNNKRTYRATYRKQQEQVTAQKTWFKQSF